MIPKYTQTVIGYLIKRNIRFLGYRIGYLQIRLQQVRGIEVLTMDVYVLMFWLRLQSGESVFLLHNFKSYHFVVLSSGYKSSLL